MKRCIWFVLSVMMLGLAALQPAAQAAPAGRAGGLDWQPLDNRLGVSCVDALQPHTLLLDTSAGTYAADWTTGVRMLLNARPITVCGRNGWVYSRPPTVPPGTAAWRFSSRDPLGAAVAHLPTHVAADSSGWVYALEPPGPNPDPTHRLWASSDAGLTWGERPSPAAAPIQDIMPTATDARVLYALTLDVSGPYTPTVPLPYAIWASTDGGATWDQRYDGSADRRLGIPRIVFGPVAGAFVPVDRMELNVSNGLGGGSGAASTVLVSTDGARSFREMGQNISFADAARVAVFFDGSTLLRQRVRRDDPHSGAVERSTDGGATWTPVPLPLAPVPLPTPGPGAVALPFTLQTVLPPGLIILARADGTLWASADHADTWQQIADNGQIFAATPYLPLTLFRQLPANPSGPQVAIATYPDAGRLLVAPAAASGAPGSPYFPPTGHTLPAVFHGYWESHGGLAQFGYPRSEPFPEANATDGKVYLTQYFERNRLEYHPQYAGTPSEVLLGLLGADLTATRRAAGEAPFVGVPEPPQPGVQYFAATRHTLRGRFAQYWQAHGGLALYGNPISEEFQERSPTDGRMYTVQYFERNRFEYHPENIGSPYDVLLGLLGNTLLEHKSWAPPPQP